MIVPQPSSHTARDAFHGSGSLQARVQICRWTLPVLLLVALLHGLQYAALMPPWGLIDEAQHVDYILHLAERQSVPVAGQSTLSPAIIDSLFSTRHWFVFHWPTPASSTLADLGVAGYSYEAYHPPLYHLLLVPVYLAVPGGVLDRLFALRLATLLLSLVTVAMFHRLCWLWSQSPHFAALATLVFAMLPERTAYVSRVNNDTLVELLGAAVCLAAVSSILRFLSWRMAVAIGVLLALGIWTKLSMIFWLPPLALAALWLQGQPDGRRWLTPLAIGLAAALALLVRNWVVYGDLTGYSAFHSLYPIDRPPLEAGTFLAVVQELFNHFWLIWWEGSQAGDVLFTRSVYLGLALLVAGSATLSLRRMWCVRNTWRTGWRSNRRMAGFVLFAAVALAYISATIYTYFQGIVPVVQGRFLAPAATSLLLLFTYGWWQARSGATVLLATAVTFFFIGCIALWGNLLPYHYYWSSVNASLGVLQVVGSDAVALLWANLAADKPQALAPWLPVLPFAYCMVAGMTFWWSWLCVRSAHVQPD